MGIFKEISNWYDIRTKRTILARYTLVLLILCSFGLVNNSICAQDNENDEWTWRLSTDRLGVERTRTEFDSLLALHELWLRSDGIKGSRIILAGAFLTSAMLDSADLTSADLTNAILNNAKLTDANLRDANLTNADLSNVNLTSAVLNRTILTNAFLFNANLTEVIFDQTNLTNAKLRGANLTDAYLINTNLTNAYFAGADLQGVNFSPKTLPLVDHIAFAFNLDEMKSTKRSKLVELREEFSKKGYKQQERKVICALRRLDDNIFESALFDLTSEYGSNLTRPWYSIIGLYFICAIIYYIAMWKKRDSGVELIEPKPISDVHYHIDALRVYKKDFIITVMHRNNAYLKSYQHNMSFYKWPMGLRLVWWSFFFSGISAFNIGFRDINFGRWLKLLTRKEFDLKPFGWVRVVSGLQALISVYLIALWVLSFAGAPFR